MKNIFKVIVLFLVSLFANSVFAENFYITNYDVNLKVNEDKSVNVVENIQVKFTSPSHGIYRTISRKNARISDISVNEQFSSYYSSSYLTLKIGNPNAMVSGTKDYSIKYLYSITDTENEFYFNIIGTQWPVKINNARFHVSMPKDFDIAKTGLSIGKYGTRGFDKTAIFKKEGNTLLGNITQPLQPYSGVTLRIEVPENYFTNIGNTDSRKKITIAGILLLTLLPFFLWYRYGKDEHITPIVTFYPPEGINSIEAEMIFTENASTKGLTALLIELADKGYLQIDDRPKDNNFTITKVKEYDGKNEIEEEFIDALFENSNSSISLKRLETSSRFYKRCRNIVDSCNKRRSSVFERSSLSLGNKFIIFICLISLTLLTLHAATNYNLIITPDVLLLLLFPIIAICVLFSKPFHPFKVVWSLGFGGIPLHALISITLDCSTKEMPVICLGILGLIVSAVCLKQMAKKNSEGQRIMAKLLGLKKFIEVSEKHRLESLVEQNPNYFYNILPYAYILGVSDKWIAQLQSIMQQNPDWYRGSHFNTQHFNRFASQMNSASIPTTSNGGISSSCGGGGFSGGGHGGGGGGSW